MAQTLTHAQYNSPMPLYSRDNVQDVVNQVTGYPTPGRPHSAMSGTFDPNQSHVYRYLQTSGQLPSAHSARYDEQGNEYPRYRGFVDANVQSPSFKRLQYVTGVDSGAEDEISHEVHPPAQTRTEEVRSSVSTRQSGTGQQGQGQPIALGYAPVGGGQQQEQYSQQQQHEQQQQQQSQRTQWIEDAGGPPVAQRDPTAIEAERDHPLDPTFVAKIAEAERPKVPPTIQPGWTRYAERKHERWQSQTGGQQSDAQPAPQAPRPAQYYRPPPSTQYQTNQYTLDTTRAAQDKWQAHYAPYRFESGNTAASQERPRSRSVEPSYAGPRRYGGNKEWMKPYIAPNLRFAYGDQFGPPAQPSYSPLSTGRTYTTSTKQQDYSQYYGGGGVGGQPSGGASPYGTQAYSSLSTTDQQLQQQQQQQQLYSLGSGYAPAQQPAGGRTSSTYDYTSTTTQSQDQSGGGATGGVSIPVAVQQTANPGPGSQYGKDTQYSRSVRTYESRKEGGGTAPGQQAVSTPWTGGQRTETQSQTFLQSENEARRQRQLMEQEVIKRAASAGPPSGGRHVDTSTTTTVRQRPVSQDNRVTTYTTSGTGPRWQQAPGAETKTQSSGDYLDAQGNKVTFTKEVYTSSDPGKEFSMLTEQEKKILEEPLQPGVVSRHITTKYYKKSTYTSSTTTSTNQTPPVTTTVTRQAIQGRPTGGQY